MVPDLADPDTYADGAPHELFARLRAAAPVYWQPTATVAGFWTVLSHAGVSEVARDPRRFSSAAGGVMLEDLAEAQLAQMRGMLLGMDPPRHREVRRPVVGRLTPRAVARLRDDVRAVCREVIEACGDGEVDAVTELAAPVPTRVIGQVMGLPPADWPHLHALAEVITRGQDARYAAEPGAAGQASAEMGRYAYELAVTRSAATEPGDDLAGVLAAQHPPAEFASIFVQLVTAGQDTTATLLSSGLLALLEHPSALADLRVDRSLLPGAVEEMLRYANPLHYFRRTATEDTTLAGTAIRRGDKVVMMFSSANRDAAVFADPQAFDIRRSPNPHLSFGFAEHFCVGAHLARLEARVFFAELLDTFADVRLAGPPERVRSNLNNTLARLPVTLAR